MSKAVNAALVDGLARELDEVESCVLVSAKDLTVEEVTDLRNRLREGEFRMRVVKNTLANVSFNKAEMPGLGDLLDGPSAVIYGGEGAIPISKVLVEEAKKLKGKLTFQGAWNEGEILDAKSAEALSKVPGRQELLGMVMGGFFGAVSDQARNMDGLFTEMQGLLEARAAQLEGEGDGS